MDPFFARNRLSAFLDGQLSEQESQEVQQAIDADPALAAEYATMQQAVRLLRARGPTRAPADFHQKVMAKVADAPKLTLLSRARRAFRQLPMEAVALAAAALLVVFVLSRPGDELAPIVTSAPPVDVKGGAAAPSPNHDLRLPSPSTTPPPATVSAPPPQAAKPAPRSAPLKKVPAQTREAYLTEYERAARAQMDAQVNQKTGSALDIPLTDPPVEGTNAAATPDGPAATPDDFAGPESVMDQGGSGNTASEDVQVTPEELYNGIQPEMATPYQYQLTLRDADVLYTLRQLARSTGGRLMNTDGQPLSVRTLTNEDNYVKVQLIVPPSEADAVNKALKQMGGFSTLSANGTPLYGAEYIAFIIDVSYLP